MTTLPYICYNTTIRQLMLAGIVPDWMHEDCDSHGMDTAEDFLCEWDWDWNWDLGKGYSKKRLDILAKARQTVKDAIEDFNRNPELKKMEQGRIDRIKQEKELTETLRKKLCPPFYAAEIKGIVNYVLQYDEEPFFTIFYVWFNRYRHTDRNRLRFFMAGIYDGIHRTPKEIEAMIKSGELMEKYGIESELNLCQLQRLVKTPAEIKGKLEYLIPSIRTKLQEYLNGEDLVKALEDENHPVWQEIMNRENVRLDPSTLARALRYFLQ